jgi:endogenous inhibitor of DNA gyrase (YacG/DUF329 family)
MSNAQSEESAMAELQIKCPKTGKFVSTGVEMDAAEFGGTPGYEARIRCPHCGETHAWKRTDVINPPT